MNIEKLPSGSYRARITVNKKVYRTTFDHKPSEREIMLAFADKITDSSVITKHITFQAAAIQYINIKHDVLSPSTLRDYSRYCDRLSDTFVNLYIDKITPQDIQIEINKLAKTKSPKTVRNLNGFIVPVIKMFRPNFAFNTTLPQKKKFRPYTPSESEIKQIIDMSVGTIYHIPFQLGVLGLRRSEIASLSHDNIKGNRLTIDSALVQNEDFEWVEKDTKTTDSTRTIYIPDCLVEEINNSEQILACHPNTLNKKLHDYQRKLGIPEFRFHDLRAFYVSYAHSCGIPDNIIMSNGGWKSETIMKRVYRRTIEEDAEYYQKALAKDLLG